MYCAIPFLPSSWPITCLHHSECIHQTLSSFAYSRQAMPSPGVLGQPNPILREHGHRGHQSRLATLRRIASPKQTHSKSPTTSSSSRAEKASLTSQSPMQHSRRISSTALNPLPPSLMAVITSRSRCSSRRSTKHRSTKPTPSSLEQSTRC